MRKVLMLLMILMVVFLPIWVGAARIDYTGYYCDAKQPLDDGTFYMTCHIVVDSDTSISVVSGELVLTNVTLESIKTSDDWVNNNGLSTSVHFTSQSGHNGKFTVADLLFTGDLSAEECEAHFTPNSNVSEKDNYVCQIIDDVYYGMDGAVVSPEVYYEECCDYTCTIIDDKYYFDSNGNSVTYEEMIEDCSETEVVVTPENPQTGIDYGYIALPLGIIAMIVIVKIAKKNTKIYKI